MGGAVCTAPSPSRAGEAGRDREASRAARGHTDHMSRPWADKGPPQRPLLGTAKAEALGSWKSCSVGSGLGRKEFTLHVILDLQPILFPENEKININGGILLIVRSGGDFFPLYFYTSTNLTMSTGNSEAENQANKTELGVL